jgi:tRNA dimethylallyltransferase
MIAPEDEGSKKLESPIIAVAGPTASGKTALAIKLAKERDGEIISVDSRQVYRTLDIGTEKISPEEMQGIPHHLIDIRDPKDSYSAGDFVADADRLIREIRLRGKTPVLAGGTHFYFDALLYGLPLETTPDVRLREELSLVDTEELIRRIREADPRRAMRLDPKNKRRLVRALEIIAAHGTVPEREKETARYDIEWHVLNPERDELRARMETRLIEALEKGLIGEVQRVQAYVGDERLNELGLEYKIIGEYLRGERTYDSLLPTLSSRLWHYARRQKAWLRKLEAEA